MPDEKLQHALALLDAIGPRPATEANRRLRAELLRKILEAIRARGGTFRWIGWEYFEHPPGQLGQRLLV
jgi:hypothetical protein